MPRSLDSVYCRLSVAFAILAVVPGALAQQGQQAPGPVLPPPSLYDETPPTPAAVTPSITHPPAPVKAEPQPMPVEPAATAPAQTPPPGATAPVETAQPMPMERAEEPPAPATKSAETAPAPVESAPVAATTSEPMEAPAEKEPWYRKLWPFGSSSKSAAAPAPTPAAAADVGPGAVAPEGRASPEGQHPGFAYDTPSKTIRTTYGQCVKTGFYDTEPWGSGECPGAAPAPVAVVAPKAAAEPAPAPVEPEPVQVQPLAPAPAEETQTLTPEPEPVPTPPAPPPPPPMIKKTTLSADALFALESFQLRATAKARLDAFAAELDQFNYERIHITGHTDPTGSKALNARLSRQRADAVKRYLVSKGLSAGKIVTEGVGSSVPVVTDKDCSKMPRGQMIACYQPDRRVEIEVSGVTMAHK
jgi:OOP family OmpA-OmpF porin